METWAQNGFGIRPKHTPGRVIGDLKMRPIKVLLISWLTRQLIWGPHGPYGGAPTSAACCCHNNRLACPESTVVGQEPSSRGMSATMVFTFHFVPLALCSPSGDLKHIPHTLHVRHQGYLQNAPVCAAYALVSGDRAGEQEKQMSTSELETWLVGGGWAGRLPASTGADNALFSKKTLGPGWPRGVAI